jgi:hypothetical protein
MSITPKVPPYPRHDKVADQQGRLSAPYQGWFDQGLLPRLQAAPVVTGRLLTDASAALPATPLEQQDLAGGHYLISYALRVLQAATTSSAVSLTISWTENGLVRTKASANLNANTTAQNDVGTFPIQADPNTPINVTVTYASSGATAMRYRSSVYAMRMPE